MCQVFDAPQAALDSIQAAVITGGNNAKSSITSTLTSFNGATSMLQDKVLSKLDMVQVRGASGGALSGKSSQRLLGAARASHVMSSMQTLGNKVSLD